MSKPRLGISDEGQPPLAVTRRDRARFRSSRGLWMGEGQMAANSILTSHSYDPDVVHTYDDDCVSAVAHVPRVQEGPLALFSSLVIPAKGERVGDSLARSRLHSPCRRLPSLRKRMCSPRFELAFAYARITGPRCVTTPLRSPVVYSRYLSS